MKAVFFPLLATSLILGGCSTTASKPAVVAAAPQKTTWSKEDVLGEWVCGTNVLIRHKNG